MKIKSGRIIASLTQHKPSDSCPTHTQKGSKHTKGMTNGRQPRTYVSTRQGSVPFQLPMYWLSQIDGSALWPIELDDGDDNDDDKEGDDTVFDGPLTRLNQGCYGSPKDWSEA